MLLLSVCQNYLLGGMVVRGPFIKVLTQLPFALSLYRASISLPCAHWIVLCCITTVYLYLCIYSFYDVDPDYLEFLKLIAKPAEHLPSAEIQLERKEAEQAGWFLLIMFILLFVHCSNITLLIFSCYLKPQHMHGSPFIGSFIQINLRVVPDCFC